MRKALPDIWRKRAVNWLSLLVLALVMLVFGKHLHERLTEAEATAVRVMLNNLRSQLVIEQGTAMAKQRGDMLERVENQNPFELTANVPDGFEGQCPARAEDQSLGSWCYAPEEGVIYYQPRFGPALPGIRGENGRHGWRLELDRDRPGMPELRLTPVANDGK